MIQIGAKPRIRGNALGLGDMALGGYGRFTPVSLFLSGDDGVWYQTADITKLFQDSAKATVVTADGDPAGAVEDISGAVTPYDALQPTAAQRPSYGLDEDGNPQLQFDEVDDVLAATLPNLGTDVTIATLLQGEAVIETGVTVGAGSYDMPTNNWQEHLMIDRELAYGEINNLLDYWKTKSTIKYGVIRNRMNLIMLNAVDAKVYDTSKDSDGGAAVQAMSPAQVAIIAEATSVKVYDATDPTLPLWRTYDLTGYTVNAVARPKNGILSISTTTGLMVLDYINDGTTVGLTHTTATTPAIVNNVCNDVAMTALSGAPIDPATGIATPTIAVATDGGISVITDGGDVWDSAATSVTASIGAVGDNIFVKYESTPVQIAQFDLSAITADAFAEDRFYHREDGLAGYYPQIGSNVGDHHFEGGSLDNIAIGHVYGVTLLSQGDSISSTKHKDLSAKITSDYNTGYMVGDTKGAWLSSTDEADILSKYAVLNTYEPEIVVDYSNDYYRMAGSKVSHDTLVTFTATGGSTVDDSDGVLKNSARNLFKYSEQFDNASWAKVGTAITANDITAPDGEAAADLSTGIAASTSGVRGLFSWTAGVEYTVRVLVKSGTSPYFQIGFPGSFLSGSGRANFNIVTGTTETVDAAITTSTPVEWGDGWFLLSATATAVTSATDFINFTHQDSGSASYYAASGATTVHIWAGHAFRSDLGGMQDNPDNTTVGLEQYVPTTTAPVYKRRNNYIYSGGSWVGPQCLVEPEAATNIITDSNSFTAATGTIAQDTLGPDGLPTSAWTLTSPAAAARIAKNVTVVNSTAHTFSCFAKAGVTDIVYVSAVLFTTPINSGVWFNLSDGAIGTEGAGFVGRITDVGAGWYRCSITFTTDASDTTGEMRVVLVKANGSTVSEAGDTAEIYGAQFEEGSVPSSYIPTNGSTLTRDAETSIILAANLASVVNTTAMSIQMDGYMSYADTGAFDNTMYMWQADSTNYVAFRNYTVSSRTGQPYLLQRETSSGLDTVSGAIGEWSPDVNVAFNVAARHGSTFINGSSGGVAFTEDVTPTALPYLSLTDFEIASGGIHNIKTLRLFGTDIGDTGIEEASNGVVVIPTDTDRSVNTNDLTAYGTITKTPVAAGAELVAYSGFSAANYLEQPYNADLDFGTGDLSIDVMVEHSGIGTQFIFSRHDGAGAEVSVYTFTGKLRVRFGSTLLLTTNTFPTDTPFLLSVVREGGVLKIYFNGVLQDSVACTDDVSNASAVVRVGLDYAGSFPFSNGKLALLHAGASAPTAAQILKMYNDELPLFQENAACTLAGASDAVTGLSHDPDSDLLHVGTSAGRSVFDGLERVHNLTDPVTTVIATSGGIVLEK